MEWGKKVGQWMPQRDVVSHHYVLVVDPDEPAWSGRVLVAKLERSKRSGQWEQSAG